MELLFHEPEVRLSIKHLLRRTRVRSVILLCICLRQLKPRRHEGTKFHEVSLCISVSL